MSLSQVSAANKRPLTAAPSAPKTNEAKNKHDTASSSQIITMEDIFETFMLQQQSTAAAQTSAAAPIYHNTTAAVVPHGQSCTLAQAIDVWSAMCRMAEEAILKRQSLVVSNFVSCGIQKETEHMGGIWRSRVSFVPCVVLAPAFVAQYCSDRSGYHVANPQKHGGAVPVLLNGSTLSSYANVPRHIATNVLKDLTRIIGKYLLEGHPATGKKVPVRVEMGFAMLDFTAVAMHVRWSKNFLDELAASIKVADAEGELGNTTGSTSPRRPHTAAARIPAPPPEKQQQQHNPQQPQKPRAGLQIRPARVVPNPPAAPSPTAASATQSANQRETTSYSSRPPSAASATAATPTAQSDRVGGGSPSPNHSRNSSRCSSVNGGVTAVPDRSPSRNAYQTTAFSNSSPRNREQFMATLEAITKSTANDYVKGKARKVAFRRMRGAAFEASWDAQLQLQRDKEAHEREEERKRVDYFRQSLAEQAAKEHNEKVDRRREQVQIQTINKALATRREELALPAKVSEPGDLFDSRHPPIRTNERLGEILQNQMAERREKEAKAKAADREYQRQMVRLDNEWNRSQREAKEARLQQQRILKEGYELQLKQKRDEEARYKATMPKSGCILYSESESATDERKERMDVKLRSREFQLENRRHVEEKEHNERLDAAEREVYNRHFREEQRALAQQRNDEEKARLRGRQANLGETLKQQMEQRKAAAAKEKYERDTWRDFSYLRNESSDDEY